MKNFIIKNLINLIPSSKKRKELRANLLCEHKKLMCDNRIGEYSYSGANFMSPNTTIKNGIKRRQCVSDAG